MCHELPTSAPIESLFVAGRERQDRRAGPRDHRGHTLPLAAGRPGRRCPASPGARYSWCSRSSVASSSSSGRRSARRPAGRRGRRSRRRRRAARSPGSSPRARSVASRRSGTNATGRTPPADVEAGQPGSGGGPSRRWSARRAGRRRRCRGGPRCSVASASASSSARSPPPGCRARAARMPATMAAEDEPSPRACGMRLTQRMRSPGGCSASPISVERRAERADDQVVLVRGPRSPRPHRSPRWTARIRSSSTSTSS